MLRGGRRLGLGDTTHDLRRRRRVGGRFRRRLDRFRCLRRCGGLRRLCGGTIGGLRRGAPTRIGDLVADAGGDGVQCGLALEDICASAAFTGVAYRLDPRIESTEMDANRSSIHVEFGGQIGQLESFLCHGRCLQSV